MNVNNRTDTLPADIPPAGPLIAELRAAADDDERAAIIALYPVLETYTSATVLGQWLKMSEQSIYASRTRTRSDGKLAWPDEDALIFGRKVWRFSTIALHRASAPARGWNLRKA